MSITLKVRDANLSINTADSGQTDVSKTQGHIFPIPGTNKKISKINLSQDNYTHFLSETNKSTDMCSQDRAKVRKTAKRYNSETESHDEDTDSHQKMMKALKSVPDPSETVQERSKCFN
jgi:hypothetical protein